MAQQDVYVPVYTVGANGKLAYQFAKINAVLTNAKVPEGAPMIDSRVMRSTPSQDIQPPETP